jgi:hypothetical protein
MNYQRFQFRSNAYLLTIILIDMIVHTKFYDWMIIQNHKINKAVVTIENNSILKKVVAFFI